MHKMGEVPNKEWKRYWWTEVLEIREQHPKDEVAKLWLDSLVIVEGEEKSGWELGEV